MREENLLQSDVQIDKQIEHSKTLQPIFICKTRVYELFKKGS